MKGDVLTLRLLQEVKEKYEKSLLSLSNVIGAGIGDKIKAGDLYEKALFKSICREKNPGK